MVVIKSRLSHRKRSSFIAYDLKASEWKYLGGSTRLLNRASGFRISQQRRKSKFFSLIAIATKQGDSTGHLPLLNCASVAVGPDSVPEFRSR